MPNDDLNLDTPIDLGEVNATVEPTAQPVSTKPATDTVANPAPAPASVVPNININDKPTATDKGIAESIEAKLEAAKEAMEGPERTAKREREEKVQKAKAEIARLEGEKATLNKQKEKLELAWVELDNQRASVRAKLQPILDMEATTEAEEEKNELEEKSSAVPADKMVIEKRRWEIESKRQDLEKQKWEWQEKLARLEEKIATNTKAYQELLGQEDKLDKEIEDNQTELI